MLQISCPWCGPRDEHEFSYGGEAHIARPQEPDRLSDAEWADYLFMRSNHKGMHLERWMHAHGCRRWFNVARDTVSHYIAAVYKVGEKPPRGIAPAAAKQPVIVRRASAPTRSTPESPPESPAAPTAEEPVKKKATTRKTTTGKVAARKTTTRKAVTRKAATRKAVTKKAASKKAATKKATTKKKTTAGKVAAKKTTTRKATRSPSKEAPEQDRGGADDAASRAGPEDKQ